MSMGKDGERGNNDAVDEHQPTDEEGTEDDVSDRYVPTESDDFPDEHAVSKYFKSSAAVLTVLLSVTRKLIVSRYFSHPPILSNFSEISTQLLMQPLVSFVRRQPKNSNIILKVSIRSEVKYIRKNMPKNLERWHFSNYALTIEKSPL